MSSVVFILGAGASKQCGAPLMANFLDTATDLLRAKRVDGRRGHFERVFSAIGGLQAVHSKAQLDLNNIESIFTAFELGQVIRRVPGLEFTSIRETIVSLKELIVGTLEETIDFPTEGTYIRAPEPYEEFAALLKYLQDDAFPAQTVSVITFNYDVAADMGMFRAQLGPDYGFHDGPLRRGDVQLLKLHGSLNWAVEKESQRVRPLDLRDYLQHYAPSGYREQKSIKVPIGTQLVEYFSRFAKTDVLPEPVIVPPSWNKADYHHALSDVWASAAKNLSEAEFVFIIGYSLPETDAFFRHLYALGSVGTAALRRILIFNPDDSGATDDRFRGLLGPGALARYDYEQLTFDKAIEFVKSMFPKRR